MHKTHCIAEHYFQGDEIVAGDDTSFSNLTLTATDDPNLISPDNLTLIANTKTVLYVLLECLSMSAHYQTVPVIKWSPQSHECSVSNQSSQAAIRHLLWSASVGNSWNSP